MLKRSEASWCFRSPVSAQDAPDYYDVIKDPMDLSTIERRLLTGWVELWAGAAAGRAAGPRAERVLAALAAERVLVVLLGRGLLGRGLLGRGLLGRGQRLAWCAAAWIHSQADPPGARLSGGARGRLAQPLPAAHPAAHPAAADTAGATTSRWTSSWRTCAASAPTASTTTRQRPSTTRRRTAWSSSCASTSTPLRRAGRATCAGSEGGAGWMEAGGECWVLGTSGTGGGWGEGSGRPRLPRARRLSSCKLMLRRGRLPGTSVVPILIQLRKTLGRCVQRQQAHADAPSAAPSLKLSPRHRLIRPHFPASNPTGHPILRAYQNLRLKPSLRSFLA
jgi:hypothetical protein